MALPVNIGDFIKLGELAWAVYRKCRDCSGEYKNLASECRTLENTLRDLGDVFRKQKLDAKREQELLERGKGCREVLTDLEALIDKYNSLSSKSKKTWDRLNWDQQGGRDIRARLTSNVAMLCAFYDTLIHSSQLRIEEALNQLAADIRGGHREASSVISFASTEDGDEDTAWPQIIRDLEDLGITATMADENRSFILDWFVRAINEGMLQEKALEGNDDDSLYASPSLSENLSSVTAVDSWSESPSEAPAAHTKQVIRKPTASSTSTVPDVSNTQTMPRTQFLSQAQYSPIPQQAYSSTTSPTPQQILPSQVLPDALTRSSSEPAKSSEDSNIIWTAQRIVHHWNKREWKEAEGYLQQQIKVVEAGESIALKGVPCQPDLRLLRHLLGVSASYQGNFAKAKKYFESVQRGPYVNGQSLDDGDIAAARWLGDTCLLLGEPKNAALAWAIALDGYICTLGITREPAPQVLQELRILNHKLKGLDTLNSSFSKSNVDASSVFSTTSNTAKAHLVVSALERVEQGSVYTSNRHRTDVRIAEGFLVQPLIAQSSWPIKWDPFFNTSDTVMLHVRFFQTNRFKYPIDLKNLPTVGIGQSKKLDYSTRRGAVWLFETLKKGLKSHGIEYFEDTYMLVCRLSQMHDGIAFDEAVGIKVRKLALRSVHGVQVTEPMYGTRVNRDRHAVDLANEWARKAKVRDEFASLIKAFLADTEKEAASQQQPEEEAAVMQAHLRAQNGGPAPAIYGHGVHVLNAAPPSPVPPATPIIYASPAPPMPSMAPPPVPPVPPMPPVPRPHVQTVGHVQHPEGGYMVASHVPHGERTGYQQTHGYYGKV